MTRGLLTAGLLLGAVAANGAETSRAAEAIAESLRPRVNALSRPVYTWHYAMRGTMGLPPDSPVPTGYDARSYVDARIAGYWDLSRLLSLGNAGDNTLRVATDPVAGRDIGGEWNSWGLIQIGLEKGFRFVDLRQDRGVAAGPFSAEIRRLLDSESCGVGFPEALFISPPSQTCRAIAAHAARLLDVDGLLYAVKPTSPCLDRAAGAFIIVSSRTLAATAEVFVAESRTPARLPIHHLFARAQRDGSEFPMPWSDLHPSDTGVPLDTWMAEHIFGCGAYPEDTGDPATAEAYFNAASGLAQTGELGRAIDFYRRALTLDPDFVPALDELAWIRATHSDPAFRNPAEAERIAEHLLDVVMHKLGRPNSKDHIGRAYKIRASQTVAAAFAANGNYSHAVECAQSSVETAQRLNEIEPTPQTAQLLAQAAEQLKLYQEGRALTTPAGAFRSSIPLGK
jgi:hypothetical protein